MTTHSFPNASTVSKNNPKSADCLPTSSAVVVNRRNCLAEFGTRNPRWSKSYSCSLCIFARLSDRKVDIDRSLRCSSSTSSSYTVCSSSFASKWVLLLFLCSSFAPPMHSMSAPPIAYLNRMRMKCSSARGRTMQ